MNQTALFMTDAVAFARRKNDRQRRAFGLRVLGQVSSNCRAVALAGRGRDVSEWRYVCRRYVTKPNNSTFA